MKSMVSVLLVALILGRISGEPLSNKGGGYSYPKDGNDYKNRPQPFKALETDLITKGVAVALVAGLGILSGGAALSALSSQAQLRGLQGNFRTVCNAIRAAGAVDGRIVIPPIDLPGPPGPAGPVGPPGPAGMDGTCSATTGNCAEAQADVNDIIARLNAVSASTCNF